MALRARKGRKCIPLHVQRPVSEAGQTMARALATPVRDQLLIPLSRPPLMTVYRIALFLHILALILAAGATAITKLAVGRRIRARTVGDALDWHNVLIAASKFFPLSLAIFVITGSYMLSVARINVWSSGFVVAGLVGVALLFVSGTFLGGKAKLLKNVLETIAKEGSDRPVPKVVPPRL